jgi:hypothetical protein
MKDLTNTYWQSKNYTFKVIKPIPYFQDEGFYSIQNSVVNLWYITSLNNDYILDEHTILFNCSEITEQEYKLGSIK